MSPGKIASQAGHAFVGAITTAQQQSPHLVSHYHKDLPSPGTKVVLACPDQQELLRVQRDCCDHAVPHFLVVDSGCENFYGGQPIATALGVGPVTKSKARKLLGKFKLL